MLDITKPVSMRRREIIETLEKDVINSGLDLYLIEPILVDALAAVRQALAQREQADVEAYKKKINEQKEQKEG